jgi:hypothetical protein
LICLPHYTRNRIAIFMILPSLLDQYIPSYVMLHNYPRIAPVNGGQWVCDGEDYILNC